LCIQYILRKYTCKLFYFNGCATWQAYGYESFIPYRYGINFI